MTPYLPELDLLVCTGCCEAGSSREIHRVDRLLAMPHDLQSLHLHTGRYSIQRNDAARPSEHETCSPRCRAVCIRFEARCIGSTRKECHVAVFSTIRHSLCPDRFSGAVLNLFQKLHPISSSMVRCWLDIDIGDAAQYALESRAFARAQALFDTIKSQVGYRQRTEWVLSIKVPTHSATLLRGCACCSTAGRRS